MTVRVLEGHVLDVLRSLPSNTFQCVATSPPYYGLRDYKLAPQVWGGEPGHAHTWQEVPWVWSPGGNGESSVRTSTLTHPTSQPQRRLTGGVRMGELCCCGAWLGSLGLEPTPELYVEHLVSVFREVRRVLRSDGVCWINLGDSYAGSGKGPSGNFQPEASCIGQTVKRGSTSQFKTRSVATHQLGDTRVDGCKPKDLLGMPWMVAFALRQPYYTGRIKDERDRIWLAAMIDAEGCIFIHSRKAGADNGQGYLRKADTYGSGLEVANTNESIVRRCMALTGIGSICSQEAGTFGRKQTIYRWNVRSNECRWILEEVYPYLVAKQQQARLAIGCPSSGATAEAAHQGLIGLHNGVPTNLDFAAPEPLFQPGFYLRSEIIWSKANPMPESVTDRPTKAHEYVFLLSKSRTYFYDADAIRETMAPESEARYEYAFGGAKAVHLTAEEANGTGTRTHPIGMREFGAGRNRRSVWEIATAPFPGSHFAVFPPKLVEPMLLAGSRPGDHVLDPFGGAGTTGLVADRLGRDCTLIELNPEYAQMARDRITGDSPLFTEVVA